MAVSWSTFLPNSGLLEFERGQLVDELVDPLVELVGLLALEGDQAAASAAADRLERLGRVELQLRRCSRLVRRLCSAVGWPSRNPFLALLRPGEGRVNGATF